MKVKLLKQYFDVETDRDASTVKQVYDSWKNGSHLNEHHSDIDISALLRNSWHRPELHSRMDNLFFDHRRYDIHDELGHFKVYETEITTHLDVKAPLDIPYFAADFGVLHNPSRTATPFQYINTDLPHLPTSTRISRHDADGASPTCHHVAHSQGFCVETTHPNSSSRAMTNRCSIAATNTWHDHFPSTAETDEASNDLGTSTSASPESAGAATAFHDQGQSREESSKLRHCQQKSSNPVLSDLKTRVISIGMIAATSDDGFKSMTPYCLVGKLKSNGFIAGLYAFPVDMSDNEDYSYSSTSEPDVKGIYYLGKNLEDAKKNKWQLVKPLGEDEEVLAASNAWGAGRLA